MRILDNDRNLKVNDITFLLTYGEACELRDSINELIFHHKENMHTHINNDDYTKEITIAIYDEEKVEMFNERYRKLILMDE